MCIQNAYPLCDHLSSEQLGKEYPQQRSTLIQRMDRCKAWNCSQPHVSTCYNKGRSQDIQGRNTCKEVRVIQQPFLVPDILYHRVRAYKSDTCCGPSLYMSNKWCDRCDTADRRDGELSVRKTTRSILLKAMYQKREQQDLNIQVDSQIQMSYQ